MSLKYLAAFAYVRSLVDNLPDDTKGIVRSLLPKKTRVVEGFSILDHNALILTILKKGRADSLLLDDDFVKSADVLAVLRSTLRDLQSSTHSDFGVRLENVAYVWTPTGLGDPNGAYYQFSFDRSFINKLVDCQIIEPHILLV